ncbi:MAG: zinc ribbon domain-containing protein [Actinobacteria bacterium]|nr:zinc ribbon domain-containing protein [Actinomycetota bacterium]MBU4385959.1 zinc ribbon domain-containing protein [Actinomycetota bacterium]MBU4489278.1 zinc ribbon domain-containing protein [Actinomycetota bacterium]
MPADARFKPQKEINRVKAQLRRLEKEKSKSFPELGRVVYQAFIEGRVKDPSLAEACGRLKAMDEQIEEANAELERLKVQAQKLRSGAPQPGTACPYCKASVAPGTRFCGNCGKDISAAAPAAPSGAASCPSCGSPVSPGTGFCGECGKPVGGAAPGVPGPVPPPPGPPKAAAPPSPPPKAPAPQPAPPCGAVTPSSPAPAPSPKPAPPAAAPPAGGPKPSGEGKPETGGGKPRNCPSCSAPIDETDAAFCGECGKKL